MAARLQSRARIGAGATTLLATCSSYPHIRLGVALLAPLALLAFCTASFSTHTPSHNSRDWTDRAWHNTVRILEYTAFSSPFMRVDRLKLHHRVAIPYVSPPRPRPLETDRRSAMQYYTTQPDNCLGYLAPMFSNLPPERCVAETGSLGGSNVALAITVAGSGAHRARYEDWTTTMSRSRPTIFVTLGKSGTSRLTTHELLQSKQPIDDLRCAVHPPPCPIREGVVVARESRAYACSPWRVTRPCSARNTSRNETLSFGLN